MQRKKHLKGKFAPQLRAMRMEEANKEAQNMRQTEKILAETTRKNDKHLEGNGVVELQKAKREEPINTRKLLMDF
jgi:hypothetical protein